MTCMSLMSIVCTVAKPDYSEAKIVLAMVGLPARGKSYLSNKLMRYLKVRLLLIVSLLFAPILSHEQWLEYEVKVGYLGGGSRIQDPHFRRP